MCTLPAADAWCASVTFILSLIMSLTPFFSLTVQHSTLLAHSRRGIGTEDNETKTHIMHILRQRMK